MIFFNFFTIIMKFARYSFAPTLYTLWQDDLCGEKLKAKNAELLEEFLRFGSETDDNLNCSEHIEYGNTTTIMSWGHPFAMG